MKKNLYLLVITFTIILSSCHPGSNSQYKVAFLLPNYESSRYVKERDYFIEKIKELGGDPLVAVANNDDKLQINQATDFINQGVKVLVLVAVNSNTAAAIVRDGHKKNIKVIAYERLIKNCDLDYYIGYDHLKAGKLMSDYVVSLKPKGNYVLLNGDQSDNNAIMLKKGLMTALTPHIQSGAIHLLYNVYIESWSKDNANHEMKQVLYLSGLVPDVVIAASDGIATGVTDRLAQEGLAGKIVVTGMDASLVACKRIVKGIQTMTIYKPFKKQAYEAATIAMKLAKHEPVDETNTTIYNGRKNVPALLLTPILVDKNNMMSTVVADKLYTQSEIYQ